MHAFLIARLTISINYSSHSLLGKVPCIHSAIVCVMIGSIQGVELLGLHGGVELDSVQEYLRKPNPVITIV